MVRYSFSYSSYIVVLISLPMFLVQFFFLLSALFVNIIIIISSTRYHLSISIATGTTQTKQEEVYIELTQNKWGIPGIPAVNRTNIYNDIITLYYMHPTSEAGVRFPARPQVGKLVVACRWSAVYSTEP